MLSKQNRQGQCGQNCAPVFGNAKLVLNLFIAIILLLPTVNASLVSEVIAKKLISELFDSKKNNVEVDVSAVKWTPTTNHVAFICCEEESSANKTCILGNTEILGECNWPNADGRIFNPYSGKINMSESNSNALLSHSQQCKRMYTGEESAPFKLKDLNVLRKGDVKNEIKTVGCTVIEQVSSIYAKKWSKVVGLDIHTIDNQNVFIMYIARQKHKFFPPICMDVFIGSTQISCNIWFVSMFYIMPFIIYWIAYYYNALNHVLALIGWFFQSPIQPNGQNQPVVAQPVIAAAFYMSLVLAFGGIYFAFDYPIIGQINGLQYNDI